MFVNNSHWQNWSKFSPGENFRLYGTLENVCRTFACSSVTDYLWHLEHEFDNKFFEVRQTFICGWTLTIYWIFTIFYLFTKKHQKVGNFCPRRTSILIKYTANIMIRVEKPEDITNKCYLRINFRLEHLSDSPSTIFLLNWNLSRSVFASSLLAYWYTRWKCWSRLIPSSIVMIPWRVNDIGINYGVWQQNLLYLSAWHMVPLYKVGATTITGFF